MLSLNELVQIRRRTVRAPIARYANSTDFTEKNYNRERSNSLTTIKDDFSPIINNAKIDFNLRESQQQNLKSKQLNELPPTNNKAKLSKAVLTFDSANGELATRWDVVYKTILRDFRRFYLDDFKSSQYSETVKIDLGDSLLEYTKSVFKSEASSAQKAISISLGCLLFPKQIIKDSKLLKYLTLSNHFGGQGNDTKNKIMQIHGFLYKFSIDKIEECFKNKSICSLFLHYIKEGKDRIRSNSTMNKYSAIYLKARKILEKKAKDMLFLSDWTFNIYLILMIYLV